MNNFIYNGSEYALVKKNIKTAELIDEISRLSVECDSGKYPIADFVKKGYEFICQTAGENTALKILETNDIYEMDINALVIAIREIIEGYNKPIRDAMINKSKEKLNDVISESDVQKILSIANSIDKIKETESSWVND